MPRNSLQNKIVQYGCESKPFDVGSTPPKDLGTATKGLCMKQKSYKKIALEAKTGLNPGHGWHDF